MATKKKLLQAAAGSAGGGGLNVEEVFSTYLYTGNGTDNRAINNGIDLSGEGGMVWIKNRDFAFDHLIGDTERGITKGIKPNNTVPENNFSDRIKTVTSTGFTLGTADDINSSNTGYTGSLMDYASWTFRKAPKFFDVVTYTGDGVAGRTVSHNLGSVPGCIIVKKTNSTSNWIVYHRANTAAPETDRLKLNSTEATTDDNTSWNDTAPTSTEFTVGTNGATNGSGDTFVAYLFAHNDGDGEFGPDGDADIIKCGSYTGGTAPISVDLGFEPQCILIKGAVGSTQNWVLFDTMRGIATGGADEFLSPNASSAETTFSTDYIDVTANGFEIKQSGNAFVSQNSATYIYIAIRRGPMAVPESADEVFAITTQSGSTAPAHDTGFVTDFSLRRENALSSTSIIHAVDRLRGRYYLNTTGTNAEIGLSSNTWDFMDGWYGDTSDDSNKYAWSWKRAPNYFDVVAYTGNGTAGRTVSHNLGVAPEMIWVKQRNAAAVWTVYHSGIGETKHVYLSDASGAVTQTNVWNDTAPTDTAFTTGTYFAVNDNNDTYIAYLFASLDGVSKLGTFTTTSGALDVDCGFSSGARFVLLKKTNAAEDWFLFDSERGIVSGNDPYLYLNDTNAEATSSDPIDPLSSGFTVNGSFWGSGNTYIFYAIA